MKFKTSQQELNRALTFVSRAVTARSTMPILKGILLAADESGTLTMTASDMDLSIEKKIGVTVSEPGSIVLPAKLFTDIIRKLPSEDVVTPNFVESSSTVTPGIGSPLSSATFPFIV